MLTSLSTVWQYQFHSSRNMILHQFFFILIDYNTFSHSSWDIIIHIFNCSDMWSFWFFGGVGTLGSRVGNVWPSNVFNKFEPENYGVLAEAEFKRKGCGVSTKDIGREILSLPLFFTIEDIDVSDNGMDYLWLHNIDSTIWYLFNVDTYVIFNVDLFLNV